MIKTIKENKIVSVVIFICTISLMYCCFNTMIANDDLGYSFLYRTDVRITNLLQALKMQVSDYRIVSSRVFIHFIVQALLIYGKNIWSILNPIFIILNFYFINRIIKLYVKDKNNSLFNYVLCLTFYLLIINYKWIIYWVAGSVNYVWTSTVLFLLIYLYLKYGFSKKNYINMFLILFISILHESTFIFTLIFLLSILIYDIIYKKFSKKRLLLLIPLMVSGAFLFLGPGTFSRIGQDLSWNSLSLIEKFKLSLPTISYNLYNFKNIYNIIPIIFVIVIIMKLFSIKNKYKYILIIPLLINIITNLVFNNHWFYFLFSILILISVFYINYFDNRNELSIIFLSMYAVSYSLCLTVEYVFVRPNYFVFVYMILLVVLYLYSIFNIKTIKLLSYLLVFVLLFLLFNEVKIYTEIGKIKQERLDSITQYKEGKTKKLKYKLANKKYYNYQIDINEPYSKEYYAYKYFLNYYNLPKDTEFEFVSEV